MNYLHWQEQKITDFSESAISAMYDKGFVFTRLGKGIMQQTRSCRIDLDKFSLTSENRRILKKTDNLRIGSSPLPLPSYPFEIGKMGKDFYEEKFGEKIMSANKIKEILMDENKSNFNILLNFAPSTTVIGYTICYENVEFLHYSYPFYDLKIYNKDIGLGMMTTAIQFAKQNGKKYIYLGSLQRPTDTYKLQFEGLEWFDGKEWKSDLEEVKKLLTK
jgi:arginyl-tRNA--protein-N-Asp/Glu arginylyltransferase